MLYGMFYLPKGNKKAYGNNVKKDDEILKEYNLKIKYDFELIANASNVFQRRTFGKKRKREIQKAIEGCLLSAIA